MASPEEHDESEQRVTPLELFFDLVFVFALTQVTSMLADDTTAGGLARGMLVLAAVWWAWAAYSWLTNALDTEEDRTRLAMFVAMAAMLLVSLAVPGAFGEDALLFAVAYSVVRVMHVVLYTLGTAEVEVHQAIRAFTPTVLVSAVLLITASALDGLAQGLVWAAALVIDYAGPLRGVEGWRMSPGHFAERYGLIVIIALGESIVAVGVGVGDTPLDAGVIAAAVLGIVVVAALWWAYFDVVALVAERRLRAATGGERNRMGRDSYSYLHLPMIAGIVLLALGMKKTLGHVEDPLKAVPAIGLCGGVALYLLAHIAFRWRNVHSLSRTRLTATVACLALLPVAMEAPALVALAGVAAVLVALIAYEAVAYREARARVRATVH